MEVRETLVKVLRPCYGKPIVLITLGRLEDTEAAEIWEYRFKYIIKIKLLRNISCI